MELENYIMGLEKSFIVFTIACVALAVGQNLNGLPLALSQSSIVPMAGEAMQANPDQAMACFNYYVPLISEIGQTYQDDVSNCTQVAQTDIQSAETATDIEREDLAKSVNESMTALTQCTQAATVQDIFDCYISQVSIRQIVSLFLAV